MKNCKTCKALLDFSKFDKHKAYKDGHLSVCKECAKLELQRVKAAKINGTYINRCRKPRLTAEERSERAEFYRTYNRQYREKNREAIAALKRQRADEAKLEGIAHYGGKCTCCGEARIEFLTMEHINGRAHEKGKRKRKGKSAWLQIRPKGWPTDITVLCFNCNCSRGNLGYCPHERERCT